MNKNIIETVVGFIVIAIAVGFIIIAYQSGNIDARKLDGYNILAQFDRADGIGIGADVRLSGLKIGSVTKMIINPKNYDAEVTLKIDKNYKIPQDSSAEIIGNGLLGDKYVAIVPGAESVYLSNNQKIEFTQSSISLESLIGKFIFGSTPHKGSNLHENHDTHND